MIVGELESGQLMVHDNESGSTTGLCYEHQRTNRSNRRFTMTAAFEDRAGEKRALGYMLFSRRTGRFIAPPARDLLWRKMRKRASSLFSVQIRHANRH